MYHQAMESMNCDADVLDFIRARWKTMLDYGATTTWENYGEEGPMLAAACFGFSAHPLNYLIRNALGVAPIEPGYRRFSVRIAPLDLQWAKGQVATPRGSHRRCLAAATATNSR